MSSFVYTKKTNRVYNDGNTVNESYVAARNALIPDALAAAKLRLDTEQPVDKMVTGQRDPVTKKADKFKWSYHTEFFCDEMNRRALEAGI